MALLRARGPFGCPPGGVGVGEGRRRESVSAGWVRFGKVCIKIKEDVLPPPFPSWGRHGEDLCMCDILTDYH